MSLGKMNAKIKEYLFYNLKRVVPVEHRAKFIQEYCLNDIDDLKNFERAFKAEKDPALRKLLAIKILEKIEIIFGSKNINKIENENAYDVNIEELRGAIKWRLPK